MACGDVLYLHLQERSPPLKLDLAGFFHNPVPISRMWTRAQHGIKGRASTAQASVLFLTKFRLR